MTVWVVIVPAVLVGCAVLVCSMIVRLRPASGQRLAARRDHQPLAHELLYWQFLDDEGAGVAVNVDLSYVRFFRLRGIDADCLDNAALERLSAGLHGVLQNIPAGTVLQFGHWTDDDLKEQLAGYLRTAAAGTHRFGQRLVAAKAMHLAKSGQLRRANLVLAVIVPKAQTTPTDGALGWVRKFPRFTRVEHVEAIERLRQLATQVSRALGPIGIRATCLPVDEVRTLAYQWLNPSRAEVVARPYDRKPPARSPAIPTWTDALSARSQLAFTSIEERRDHLAVGDRLLRVLTLKGLPNPTCPALIEDLLVGLGFHCRVHMAVELLDTTKTLDSLKRKRDQAHLLATLREKRNQEAEAQEEDIAEVIDKSLRGDIRFVQVALSIVLTVDGTEPDAHRVLEKQTADVIQLVTSLNGAQVDVDHLNQLDEFVATLPGSAGRGRRWFRCTSENASHLLPVWQSWTGVDQPLFLVQNGRANLVGLNPFDSRLDNYNAFMAGASGSGKSSTTINLLLNLLAAGTRAIIIDVGGSYRRLVDLFGGQYFSVELDDAGACGLNPFFPHADAIGSDGKLDDNRLAFIMAVVERMVIDHERTELRHVERAVLSSAIGDTYRRVGDRTPILSDLVSTLVDCRFADDEDTQIARLLARSLRIWTHGPAARLINRPSTITLETHCVAFDLKGVEGHRDLQEVVLLIISGLIWNVIMRDKQPKTVVFDEVWRLLEAPASAKLIAELYRTSRKYNCSILTLSQSVEDFIGSSIAPALINNSATAYFLKHVRGHELVADHFHLNKRERHNFERLEMRRGEYTELLALRGPDHFVARIVPTPLEYWIATTHPPDLALERDFRARHPELSLTQALWALAERYPRGAGDAAPAPQFRPLEAAHG